MNLAKEFALNWAKLHDTHLEVEDGYTFATVKFQGKSTWLTESEAASGQGATILYDLVYGHPNTRGRA